MNLEQAIRKEEKKKILQKQFEAYASEDVCVAFSGGVDSSLVLVMACQAAEKTGKKVYAVTMDTVLHPKADLEAAEKVLAQTTAIHEILTMDELAVPQMADNPRNRCYLCKKALYTKMLEFAREKGVHLLLEGSNEDDLHVYRPGLQAIQELGVKSPLAQCKITKAEVRALAREYHINTADRPSTPCLATRLPYGARIDLELLKNIERAERYLRTFGWKNIRLRVHDTIARIEADVEVFPQVLAHREEIIRKLKELGFLYVTMDLEGFRSGSMDIM